VTAVVYAARTLIVLVVLGIALRLLGKREASQLTIYDLAMIMALSNAVQNALTGGRGDLSIGLASAGTIVFVTWLFASALRRRPDIERRFVGVPTLLVYDGRPLRHRMRRELVSDDDLRAALRERGLSDTRQARMVVLEVDGSITVVPRSRHD
jgi:uncharacterized membrane protein YcaP (DUF421 family)